MILCEDLQFRYEGDPFTLRVNRFSLEEKETVALIGPSGCGKTTFLNLLAGILQPESGQIRFMGKVLTEMGLPERQQFRREMIGMIPQNFELLDYLTLRENLMVPFWIGKSSREDRVEAAKRIEELAERTGISPLLEKYPTHVSQGERQRAALCRGVIRSPQWILADEPTGNLDTENQEKIVSLLLEEADRIGAGVIMITHEPTLQPRFDRVVDLLELREEVLRP